MAALYIGGMGAKGKNFYNALVSRYGYEAEAAEIQDLYLAGKKDEAAPSSCPDELLEAHQPRAVRRASSRSASPPSREAGVSVLNVTPVGPDPASSSSSSRTGPSSRVGVAGGATGSRSRARSTR